MAEQNNQIDNFITQGMDAIILNLVQTSSADAAIDKIVAANIPCILINREPLGDKGDESYEGILNNAKVCYAMSALTPVSPAPTRARSLPSCRTTVTSTATARSAIS